MQRERRENPYPFDWQLAAAGGGAALLAVPVLGLHLGRLLANLMAGAGPTLTAQDEIFTSLPDLLRGDAAAGLGGPPNTPVATPGVLWAWSAVVTLVLAALSIWAVARWWHRHGPGKVLGMATRDEAEQLLGLARLRKHRHVIRPDLYARRRASDILVAIATRRREEPTTREAQTW